MILIQFGHYICYFCSICPIFFFELSNFVFLQIENKFNFYINVIMMFLLILKFLLNIFCLGLQLV